MSVQKKKRREKETIRLHGVGEGMSTTSKRYMSGSQKWTQVKVKQCLYFTLFKYVRLKTRCLHQSAFKVCTVMFGVDILVQIALTVVSFILQSRRYFNQDNKPKCTETEHQHKAAMSIE